VNVYERCAKALEEIKHAGLQAQFQADHDAQLGLTGEAGVKPALYNGFLCEFTVRWAATGGGNNVNPYRKGVEDWRRRTAAAVCPFDLGTKDAQQWMQGALWARKQEAKQVHPKGSECSDEGLP
jgi:hypothetical protein